MSERSWLVTFGETSAGRVRSCLRPFPATLLGLALLALAIGVAMSGGGVVLGVAWAVFTVGWLSWFVAFSATTVPAAPVSETATPGTDFTGLTPAQRAVWERTLSERAVAKARTNQPRGGPIEPARRTPGQMAADLYVPPGSAVASDHFSPRSPDEQRRLRHASVVRASDRTRMEREVTARIERNRMQELPPAPGPQPFGVSHFGAEQYVAAWMRHLGVPDASVTRASGDGGVDVESEYLIAQVKNYTAATVPIAEVRDLFGTATDRKKQAVLFTSSDVSAEGYLFAERNDIALLRYSAVAGTLSGLNRLGAAIRDNGFPLGFGYAMPKQGNTRAARKEPQGPGSPGARELPAG